MLETDTDAHGQASEGSGSSGQQHTVLLVAPPAPRLPVRGKRRREKTGSRKQYRYSVVTLFWQEEPEPAGALPNGF
jgi:hypothetical protein